MNPESINRRQLFVAAGTLAATSALSANAQTPAPTQPRAAPKPDEGKPLAPKDRVGIAIVGIGAYASQQIIPSFAETKYCRLAGFVTGDAAKGRDFANRFGVAEANVFGYDQMAELANRPDIDAVYIITPNGLHREHTEAAAKAGKHVLCEKPIATSPQDAEAMIKACADAKRLLMMGYRCQYEPYNLRAIEICRSGRLGRLVSMTSEHSRTADPSDPRDTWRLNKKLAGGGSLPDIGIYSLNAMRYLTGEEPTEIQASISSPPGDPRFKEVEATVHFTLRFPSGVLANCQSSYDTADVKRGQVFGTDAILTLDPLSDYYRHNLSVSSKPKGSETPVEEKILIPEKNQFALQLDHFAQCVRTGQTPRSPGEEGLRDVRYIEGIYRAAREGKPVKVNG
ncbi:MAG: Gfo/Idh/MocA family oxidoreductase [Armatimonadetes bacterium]|nr:Gfo/Idh/MocA family oxidoreductase [Armatimonadota bacterium]